MHAEANDAWQRAMFFADARRSARRVAENATEQATLAEDIADMRILHQDQERKLRTAPFRQRNEEAAKRDAELASLNERWERAQMTFEARLSTESNYVWKHENDFRDAAIVSRIRARWLVRDRGLARVHRKIGRDLRGADVQPCLYHLSTNMNDNAISVGARSIVASCPELTSQLNDVDMALFTVDLGCTSNVIPKEPSRAFRLQGDSVYFFRDLPPHSDSITNDAGVSLHQNTSFECCGTGQRDFTPLVDSFGTDKRSP